MNNYKIGFNVLKFSLVLVYCWFGFQQITNPNAWIGMVPDWIMAVSPFTAKTLIYINGIFEIVASVLLVFNVYTRVVSIVLFGHLLIIVSELGISPSGVRDVGLAGATLALAFLGRHE